jgi:hypothetical protein
VHYVSQDVTLTAVSEKQLPLEVVLEADVGRRILLEEQAQLLAVIDGGGDGVDGSGGDGHGKAAVAGKGGANGAAGAATALKGTKAEERLQEVGEALAAMDADGAPARAAALLSNLGFSEALASRQMEALSGGRWAFSSQFTPCWKVVRAPAFCRSSLFQAAHVADFWRAQPRLHLAKPVPKEMVR